MKKSIFAAYGVQIFGVLALFIIFGTMSLAHAACVSQFDPVCNPVQNRARANDRQYENVVNQNAYTRRPDGLTAMPYSCQNGTCWSPNPDNSNAYGGYKNCSRDWAGNIVCY